VNGGVSPSASDVTQRRIFPERFALRLGPSGTSGRVGTWFCSLLFAVGLFSLLVSRGASVQSATFVFKVTMVFALPVSLLCLPVVFFIKSTGKRQVWILLAVGLLIGPVCLAVWGLILQLRSTNAQIIWQGDGESPGVVGAMLCAAIVGLLTTAVYTAILKLTLRQSNRA
jgi:hypothetical protein